MKWLKDYKLFTLQNVLPLYLYVYYVLMNYEFLSSKHNLYISNMTSIDYKHNNIDIIYPYLYRTKKNTDLYLIIHSITYKQENYYFTDKAKKKKCCCKVYNILYYCFCWTSMTIGLVHSVVSDIYAFITAHK